VTNVAQIPKVEQDLRYIYGKLPVMTDRQIGLAAAFIRGFKVYDISLEEYDRELPTRSNKE
jgi:hypothetical protein